ncbi:helicase [Tritrichomonas foetus]|uniref:RNA helicase n=1 Tax=Tritrichomonas foetus TaxID=1144522 RepID=A0A1J4JHU8_9EUKA|nr:helicase [Tritrichomonas foetus]|eukprot:OHS98297.1 helicase [Tritrichomonas foetus]
MSADELDVKNNNNINPWTNKPYSERYYDILKQRMQLPVFDFKDELISTIRNNKITIVEGATGSGKTTQIPQFLLEADIIPGKKILCTQPRRVAATSVAHRVADELDVDVGSIVGYVVRFDSKETKDTKLIYMTDGLLMREFVEDSEIQKYGVVLIDEAHERNVNTDIIIGLLKKLVDRRDDIRVVVMSATLEVEKFQNFFGNIPTLSVPGRLFDVSIHYLDEPIGSYIDAAVTRVCDIHQYDKPGGILLFLTGEEEIEVACNRIRDKISAARAQSDLTITEIPDAIVFPLYASLPAAQQAEVFKPVPDGVRKIIVSTNIAETSVTITGIVYVVDPGFVKQNQYDPERHMSRLIIVPVSQAAANQRAGRAGRTQAGHCYRLYTEDAFNLNLSPQTVPEIQRCDLAQVILTMLATGITDIVNFPFLDRPPKRQMLSAVEDLYHLGAITIEGKMTEDGRNISLIPVTPRLAKTLISGSRHGCAKEIAMLVAVLGEQGKLFSRPAKDAKIADERHFHFASKSGDHMMYLNAFQEYLEQRPSERRGFCEHYFLNYRLLERADKSRAQLESLLRQLHININYLPPKDDRREEKIIRALLDGMFQQIAMFDRRTNRFIFLFSPREAEIHASSMLKDPGNWILYNDYIFTKADYLVIVSNIDPKWVFEAAPTYFQPENFQDSYIKRALFKNYIPPS